MVPSPSQSTMGVSKQITFLIHYYRNARLVIALKVTDAPINVSGILGFAFSLMFITFGFQIFLLFVPGMSTSSTSYSA
jgi:hypothetical protein